MLNCSGAEAFRVFGLCMYFLPREGLYPLPWLREMEVQRIGTLALKGAKHLSGVPGIVTATFESMVALKATLMLSEIKRCLLCNKTLQYVYTSFLFVCVYHQFDLFPESSRTLLFSVLTPCHKCFILKKVSSSISYMSLAAQQQPRWRLKVQLQSHLSHVRGSFHLPGRVGSEGRCQGAAA